MTSTVGVHAAGKPQRLVARGAVRAAGALAVTLSLALSAVWGIGFLNAALDREPELVRILPDNPRYDFFASPLIEPHTQDIGPTSKHFASVDIAVRVLREPSADVVLALRVLSTPTGEVVRESTTVVWKLGWDSTHASFPTGVLWRTFEFVPVGLIAQEGLTISVLPLDEHAQHVGLGLSRPEEIPESNVRKGAAGEGSPWDLTFTAAGLMTQRERIGYLLKTDALIGVPGAILSNADAGIRAVEGLRERPFEWLVWLVALGVFAIQLRRAISPAGGDRSGVRRFLTAWCGLAWVLAMLWLVLPLVWPDLPRITSGATRIERGPLPVVGAIAWVALGMRLIDMSFNGLGQPPRTLPAWLDSLVEAALALGLGLIGLGATIGLLADAEAIAPVLGAGGIIALVAVLGRLFLIGVRPMQPGHRPASPSR